MFSRNKKKRLIGESLSVRINLWYTILMCVMSLALISCVVAAARTADKAAAQQNLIRSVERNLDEIEVENRILDIESDFAFVNGEVYALVFNENGKLLGGAYPDGADIDEPLQQERFEIINGYYVYDSRLEFMKYEFKVHGVTGDVISAECDGIDAYTPVIEDLNKKGDDCEITYRDAVDIALDYSGINPSTAELILAKSYEYNDEPIYEIEFYSPEKGYSDIWVRGVMKADSPDGTWSILTKIAAVLIPLIIILAATVGRFISRKSLLPVKELSEAISETRSGNDLTKRIRTEDSDPALITLTESFNAMFERLAASFNAERQFTSDVSHELRTPIAVILAECEYQMSRDDLTEEDKEGIETVRKQAESMNKTVSQLLYFSRMEQGMEAADLHRENLSELINAVCDDIGYINEKDIIITRSIKDDIEMELDISMMTRLAVNLISNAVTYGKEKGNVTVSLDKNESEIIFSVADDGIGIPKDEIEKIWQRFYRVDKARSREQGCSGLGLPMVKQIALLHKGRVEVESEEGKGSTFRVIFDIK